MEASRRWILIASLTILFVITIFLTNDAFPFSLFATNDSSSSELRPPPRLAYFISGSVDDGERLKRALQALYHPLNFYAVHLDLESPLRERMELAEYVREEPVFSMVGNVEVMTKANLVTYRGPTMVTNTLQAAAILLRKSPHWDWFINLSASDYPLVTQDDLLHTFAYLPRDLNFIEHTSDMGWKESMRARPVIVDPALYMLNKSDLLRLPLRRSVPTAFKLFTAVRGGVGLSRSQESKRLSRKWGEWDSPGRRKDWMARGPRGWEG
ncbi:hypothetical protein AMTR_s00133p00049080 [Amborella trichopoda]|uniref:Uncharacterized protein n=1 Tax=Amborella trichopoda TaxID=13333 RepID=W1PBK6_AMBTC|nr:hypothetical protein AMTR_s00133p00049080 [Amborella trichopoda]